MNERFQDKPEHVKAVRDLVATLDGEALSVRMNEVTGGSLRGGDAVNVARMVALAALRNAPKAVTIAGLRGEAEAGTLTLSMVTPVAEMTTPELQQQAL